MEESSRPAGRQIRLIAYQHQRLSGHLSSERRHQANERLTSAEKEDQECRRRRNRVDSETGRGGKKADFVRRCCDTRSGRE